METSPATKASGSSTGFAAAFLHSSAASLDSRLIVYAIKRSWKKLTGTRTRVTPGSYVLAACSWDGSSYPGRALPIRRSHTFMTAPRRRWSFSLRTLFVVVTVMTISLALAVAYSAQLDQAAAWTSCSIAKISAWSGTSIRRDRPRLGSWLLGETGIQSFHVAAPPWTPDEVERIQRLFPEAQIEYILLPVVGM